MEQRPLGSSDVDVSVLALGTMTFGAEADEGTSHEMLDLFADAGGTLIDTADVYSRGASEEIVGRWLAGRSDRDRFVIATKGRFAMGGGPDDSGAGRAHLENAVDASLDRLGVDVIDLYQVHAWDPAIPLVETLDALTDMVDAGKVRHVGVSNYTAPQLATAATTARLTGRAPIVSLQPQYSLLERTIELDVVPTCLEEGIGILPWSPLGGGWLTGKYSADRSPSGATRLGENPRRGVEAYDLRNTDRTWTIVEACRGVADAHGAAPSQVAIAWLMRRPGVSSVILGARTADQLAENLGSATLTLDSSEDDLLTDASAPGIPIYPHGFLERYAGVTTWDELGTRSEPPPIGV
jgi:aryl-alcohol dehydrogenase (NADP+)